jgi:hypothetical protein
VARKPAAAASRFAWRLLKTQAAGTVWPAKK